MLDKEAMRSFGKPQEFLEFLNKLKFPEKWKIETGLLNERGKRVSDKYYTSQLRQIFNEKKLFRRNVSIAEIVSWLDGFVLMARVIKNLEQKVEEKVFNNIKIHFEYRIRMSKNRRIDYVLGYENRILIIELRLSDKFPNLSNTWQKKELELIVYKELLNNYLPRHTKIIIYAFIFMPEYNESSKILKNIKYNFENINFFTEYIMKYLLNIKE